MSIKTSLTAFVVMAALALPAGAQEADDDDDDDAPAAAAATTEAAATGAQFDYGPSGIMARANRADLAPLTLGSGKNVAEAPYDLKSGGYYRIKIVSDGSQELALSGGDFFRAVWVNEVVINDIEIRPMGVHSLEFDAAGEAEISFIAIQPGSYSLSIPGSTGETQKAVFNIR
ncbi:hypothetical protein IQ24_02560 [Paracoccus sulfuroxidans]|uniref:MSP domain-containing protein n=2 Tax=Paracoccus sulfuroxidans TaxID=384678 RepID=A0A562NMH2_9RHOB|nr:hypothetical protein IQ24_02560 [Paracoccus sulfuroxidans]